MDIKYKNEFEFLDLSGLDDRTKVEINIALNSGTATEVLQLPWDTGESDYYEADVATDNTAAPTWQNYESEQAAYEGEMDPSGGAVMSTIPSTHIYQHPPPQIMTTVYGGMVIAQPNMYVNEMVPEVSMHSYVPGVDYQQQVYIQGSEIHDVSMNRDNRRRNHRVRGGKRDTNNRYMDPNNEITSGYHSQQAAYHRIPRNMCSQTIYYPTEPPNSPRQRTYHPGTTLYPQPLSHPGYTQVCQQYTRHAPVVQNPPRQRHDIPKHSIKRNNEPTPRPTASAYGPPPLSSQRKTTEAVNSSQTNIDCVTTVIVNNSKIEHSVNNEKSESAATTAKYSSNNNNKINLNNSDNSSSSNNSSSNINNNSNNNNNNNNNNNKKVPPVNVTIEHNIVATVNKNCELSEKSDVPFVNINSSIQVKQESDNNMEMRKETVSLEKISLPEVKLFEPVMTKDVKIEVNVENNVQEIVVETKEPENLNAQQPITPTTRAPPESSISWAGILKKPTTDNTSGITNGKPMARIIPHRIDNASDTDVLPKVNFSTNEAPGTRQLHGKPRAFPTNDNTSDESTAPNRNETHEEYNSSNKFDDLDARKTGEFLTKYQMEKQTVSLLPRGLINRNNYCYINSILQALLACPPFYNLLVALPYSKNNSRNNTSNNLTTNMIRFVHEFAPLSAGARLPRKDRAQKRSDEAVVNVQSGIAFEPSYVYTMLKNTSCASVFSVEGRQEDAEEFLSCLLNGISDEMLEMMKLGNSKTTSTIMESEPVQPNHGGEQEEWKIMGPKNKGSITRCTDFGRTPLSDIFRGQLRYKVSRAGEQSTDNVQPFFTLQLDIEKAESVNGALEILVGKDQLEGMTCSKTKREIEAWKQVTLEELPVILILHLKWFDYKLDGCSKILKSVEFPIDLKIDSKILSSNAAKKLSLKQKQYKLFAVTYHDGKEATKGHYVTDAFHVGYGGWVRYDDSSLRGVSEHNVLNPSPPRVPYLLYYRRCDTIGNNPLNSDRIR